MDYTFRTKATQEEVRVFLPEEEIDAETTHQMRAMVENPTVMHPRFMPDVHRGHGCCVGFTGMVGDCIVPAYVGGDIGCGITCVELSGQVQDLAGAERAMARASCGEYDDPDVRTWSDGSVLTQEEVWRRLLSDTGHDGAWLSQFWSRVGCSQGAAYGQLGTLGGGNHYFELNRNAEGRFFATVHSGSRALGQAVCRYHQGICSRRSRFDAGEFEKRTRHLRKVRDRAERHRLEREVEAAMRAEQGPPYLQGEEAAAYLEDMRFTQAYAAANRRVMLAAVGALFDASPGVAVDTVHNYVDLENRIMRKGAVSAQAGELCIVSLNMRDGVLLCRGKGNPDWNFSGPHGCGRVLDRKRSKRLDLRAFKKQMEGVHSTSVGPHTLDEAPDAYRDPELIRACVPDTLEVVDHLLPVANYKNASERP